MPLGYNQLDLAAALISFGLGLLFSGHQFIGPVFIVLGGIYYILVRQIHRQTHPKLYKATTRRSRTAKLEPTLQQKIRALDAWYYSKDGEVVGPVAEGQLLILFDMKSISEDTLVYNSEIGKEWCSFDKEFSGYKVSLR